ncbi:hypothetical protein AB0I28_33105 [Phytomonospora sp. NPDC050363]|uniref:hypothetical protein n=1 Tax=Phytomonospora sp. NPDC050363 TaxID=3155642 RepID=UPI0033BFDFEE
MPPNLLILILMATAAILLMPPRLTALVASRIHRDDEGEGPLSTAIIVAGLAALAVIVVGVIVAATNGYLDLIPGGD